MFEMKIIKVRVRLILMTGGYDSKLIFIYLKIEWHTRYLFRVMKRGRGIGQHEL